MIAQFEIVLILVILIFAILGNLDVALLALGILVGFKWKSPKIIPANENFEEVPTSIPEFYDNYKETVAEEVIAQPPREIIIDDANIQMALARSRDKRIMTAAAVKDASFYKYHYGPELDETEKKVWWGEDEY